MGSEHVLPQNDQTGATADLTLLDEDMTVMREESASSDEAAKNRQNQQNYQNN